VPETLVPASANNPRTTRGGANRLRNLCQNLGFGQAAQIQPLQLLTHARNVDMSVGKTRKGNAVDLNPAGVLGRECFHLGAGTNRKDSSARHSHCFSLGMRAIQREKVTGENGIGYGRLPIEQAAGYSGQQRCKPNS